MIGQKRWHLISQWSPTQAMTPNYELPMLGQPAQTAYRYTRELLADDGDPQKNMASYVTTRMEASAQRLALESLSKNLVNAAEYPGTERLHQRVIRMTAQLFHAPLPASEDGFIGTTTVGSSEAMMLALLAHKWNWKQQRRRSAKDQPYLVIGTHTHACFTKFARYFEVNVKWIPLAPGQYAITAEQVRQVLETRIADDPQVLRECGFSAAEAGTRQVGELVMAIGCVLGTTYTGALDDVAGIDGVLSAGNWDIPIHVDAASGGFVLPFTQPERKWDFRLPHVASINVSNHKYGMVYAGLGTLVLRDERVVPEELLVDVHYLSGEMRHFGLNFSRASQGVVWQYDNFLQLGRAGYERVMGECLGMAQMVAGAMGPRFEVVSEPAQMPVVAVRLRDPGGRLTLTALAAGLRQKGWLVPVYRLPANLAEVEVLRVVIKPEFTRSQANALLRDWHSTVKELTVNPQTEAVSSWLTPLATREVL